MIYEDTDTNEAIDTKELRIKLKLSLTNFAAIVGISYLTAWRWEHNKTKPSGLAVKNLQKLKGMTEGKNGNGSDNKST